MSLDVGHLASYKNCLDGHVMQTKKNLSPAVKMTRHVKVKNGKMGSQHSGEISWQWKRRHVRKHHFPTGPQSVCCVTKKTVRPLTAGTCPGRYINDPALKSCDLQVFHISAFSDNREFYSVPLSTNQVLKLLIPQSAGLQLNIWW